jgi:hypothetical protein
MTPEQFAQACRAIVLTEEGDAAHRQLDELVSDLLIGLGFGEGIAIFRAAVRSFHQEDRA